jgi:hypothetical protein
MRPRAPSGFSNYSRIRKLLVGAVGIENKNGRDFKDLREMRRNTKSLKRNDREGNGILIAPLKLPRFSCPPSPIVADYRPHCREWQVGFLPKSRGTNGEPKKSFLNCLQSPA